MTLDGCFAQNAKKYQSGILSRLRKAWLDPLSKNFFTPLVTPKPYLSSKEGLYSYEAIDFVGGRTRTRTLDPLIKSQQLKMLRIGPNQQ